MDLLGAVTGEEMRLARVVTGATFAAFLAVGFAPGLRQHAFALRMALLALYLLVGVSFVVYAMLR